MGFLAGLSTETFFAPQGRAWSPAWHVRHLSKSNFPVGKALRLPRRVPRLLFGAASRPSRSFEGLREAYLARLAAGGQAGRFAPSDRPLPPDLDTWRRELLSVYGRSVEGWTAASERWPEEAVDRARLPHPLLGKITGREMLFFTLYHNAHHLNLIASRL